MKLNDFSFSELVCLEKVNGKRTSKKVRLNVQPSNMEKASTKLRVVGDSPESEQNATKEKA